jgi:(1->4)-alpha-D-glucan 1-alpha-D-glucosylmutase
MNEALIEVTACLLVYRTYVDSLHLTPEDRACLELAVSEAKRRRPEITGAVLDFIRRVLLLDFPAHFTPADRQHWLRFVMRWQQLTGPVMAKGVEDTTYYVHNRFLSLNEVGGNPTELSREQFHRFQQARCGRWPHTMNATSTHDTKRSEDVRARINVLSELAGEFARHAGRWSRDMRGARRMVQGRPAPDPNDEFMLYQTLAGAYPLDQAELPGFRERLRAFAIKAVKEGKEHSSWLEPNPEYEEALAAFCDALLDPSPGNLFLPHFRAFQERVAFYGAVNSLAQVVLKIASPGFPDFYQGTVLWDFSLVDPDNRRPVNYERGAAALASVGGNADPASLLETWQDGRIKAFFTQRGLALRARERELLAHGDYLPLLAAGDRERNVMAFARRHEGRWLIAAAPRLFAGTTVLIRWPIGRRLWRDTEILLPLEAPQRWRNELTGEVIGGHGKLSTAQVFSELPGALLCSIP